MALNKIQTAALLTEINRRINGALAKKYRLIPAPTKALRIASILRDKPLVSRIVETLMDDKYEAHKLLEESGVMQTHNHMVREQEKATAAERERLNAIRDEFLSRVVLHSISADNAQEFIDRNFPKP